MTTYPDEYLEYYADRYVALYLKGHGVTLDQYLYDPARYEPLAEAPLPLLPEQQAVQARLDAEAERVEAEVAHLPRRNGAVVEPLHHHRHPRSAQCDFKRRTAQ
ncbi:hypothetical protein [Halomonas sp. E14]|uniref:hypothetical protein n=1 Tax=Halomonas sp. E14 TaxID=3397245 RepID=UPI00403E36F2